jgi:probable DNA repair protein
MASKAYETLLRWDIDWRENATRQLFEFSEDSALFIRWADAFESALAGCGLAMLDHALPQLAAEQTEPCIVLAEFSELAPLHRRALEAQALRVVHHHGNRQDADCHLRVFDTHAEEIEAAADWATRQFREAPQRRLAILLPSLQQERRNVERALRRSFGAELRRPESLPVNFSAGVPLSTCMPVTIALELLGFVAEAVPTATLTHLVRSRYRHTADTQQLELAALRRLQLRGREPVSLQYFRATLQKTDPTVPLSSLRLPDPTDSRTMHQRRLPSEWLTVFQEILAQFGWPGPGPLDSVEYQQVAVFLQRREELATLDRVCGQTDYRTALSLLEQVCRETVFQPETPDAPIQVLGLLEAAGLEFDAVWVCGMVAGAFPAPASPNPLIPLGLQRSLRMPHADAQRELDYAQTLLAQLRCASGELIASYARLEQDTVLPPSPLVANFTAQACVTAPRTPHYWPPVADPADALEQAVDTQAPLVSPEEAKGIAGGSAVLGDQAMCPFRAFARHRLGARTIPEVESGLSAAERGSLVHSALYCLWGSLENSEHLHALNQEQAAALADASAAEAVAAFRSRKDAVTLALLELEQRRLGELLLAWLDIERQREAFVVKAREQTVELEAGPLTLRLQLDRIDQLSNGEQVLIDYKTANSRTNAWLGERLEDPQLPLYASAVGGDQLQGISFAILRPDALEYRGLAAVPVGPGVRSDIASATNATPLAVDDWSSLLEQWQQQLDVLVEEFLHGQAAVDPIDRKQTCKYCGLEALCRIAS